MKKLFFLFAFIFMIMMTSAQQVQREKVVVEFQTTYVG